MEETLRQGCLSMKEKNSEITVGIIGKDCDSKNLKNITTASPNCVMTSPECHYCE